MDICRNDNNRVFEFERWSLWPSFIFAKTMYMPPDKMISNNNATNRNRRENEKETG